jgi:hypothetical protein
MGKSALRTQQGLDRAALVHCAIALRHLVKGQGQVEDLAGIDLPVPHHVDKLRQEPAHRGGTTMKVDVGVEELFALSSTPCGTPTKLTYPPLRVERIACIIDSWVPTHSSTESAPMPSVIS